MRALGSRTLCQRHNSDLSDLDTVGGRFVEHLETVAREFNGGDQREWLWGLNGHDVERWLLKTLCGLLAAGWGRTETGDGLPATLPPSWLEILFGRRTFPRNWGLYVAGGLGQALPATQRVTGFAPVSSEGAVVGLQAELVGAKLTLLMMDVPDRRTGAIDDDAIYRPRYLRFEQGSAAKTIYFHWDQLGPIHAGVITTWSAPEADVIEPTGA